MNWRKLIGVGLCFAVGAATACGGDDATDIGFGNQGGGLADASTDGSQGGSNGLAGTIQSGAGGASGNAGSSAAGSSGAAQDGGPGTGDTGTRDGSANPDGSNSEGGGTEGGVISCGVFNDACQSGTTCCSGICDASSHTCASVVGKCSGPGTPCAAPTDCCSLNCGANKICDSVACTSDGQACANNGQCCGGTCTNSLCKALNTSCRTAGNACTSGAQCCSNLCGTDGHCLLGASYCIQTGDACVRGSDCCGGICNKAANATLGTCVVPSPGGTRCSGAVDGTVCNGCGSCCSRLCAPYAPTGVFICQPANGCHIDGDLCVRDKDCCGNDNSLPTSGKNVQCVRENPNDPVGLCRNPMGCSPEGNVCHYKEDMNYACTVSSAPNDCCGAPGNSGACQLDQLGVPRCHAIGTCRKGGETCAFTNDCCNNVPCVPDDTGQLRCLLVPDGGTACVQPGGNCTITGDCCPGTSCIVPQGSILGKCGVVTPPPSDGGVTPPADAGGSDATTPPPDGAAPPDATTPPPDAAPPVCSQYGQICNGNPDCCNGIPCTGGICRIPPM